ncbi:MAG: hypothetical protein KDL87_14060, partial [Verrucomicrobiae bacterium]|nr:hypothetical protein [Verrucomicrobiae bacterium]
MAADSQPETKAELARRRWLWRWLGKLTLWFLVLSLVIFLIVGVVGFVAYRNLTSLANLAVSRFAQPYRIEFGEVDVSNKGVIRLRQVKVKPPEELAGEQDLPWVTLEGADLNYDLRELARDRHFRDIVLRGPTIRIDDASLETFGLGESGAKKNEGETPPPFDFKSLGRVTDRIEVVGGKWDVDTS